MTKNRRATIWLLSMCAIWGSSFVTMDYGTKGVGQEIGETAAPSAFLFMRFLVAALMFPLVFPRVLRQLTPRVAFHGFVLALPFYAGFLLQVTGLRSTTPTLSAFLTNLTVVLTPLLGRLFFREALTRANITGVLIALVGVYVLTNPGGGRLGTGELVTLACSLAFAVHIQLTNVITRKSDPEAITFVMFLCAVLFSGATLLALGVFPDALVRSLSRPNVAWTVLHTGIACSIVAITIMNRFQRELPATRAAVLYTLEPVFAAVFAAFAPAPDEFTWRVVLGGVIILGGNLACEVFGARAKKAA